MVHGRPAAGCMSRQFCCAAKAASALAARNAQRDKPVCDRRLRSAARAPILRWVHSEPTADARFAIRAGLWHLLCDVHGAAIARGERPARTPGARARHAQAYRQPRRQIRPRREPAAADRHPGDRPPDADPARPRREGGPQHRGLRDGLPRLADRLARGGDAARQGHPRAQPHQVHGRPERGPGRHRAVGLAAGRAARARASTTACSACGTARAPASTAPATCSATPTTPAPPSTAACSP